MKGTITVRIREAAADDADEAQAVIAAAYAPWRARLPDLPDVTDGVAGDIARGPAWVAEAEGRIAGVLLAGRDGTVLHVANIAVRPGMGGQGIGAALMREAETWAARAGCTLLRLATHAAMTRNVGFYERLGWQVTARDGNKVLMARHLPSRGKDG